MGTAASEHFVTVENVSRKFNSVVAVNGVTLDIPSGIIFGLVGSDGAGKSTLLRMIATMIPPDSGQIRINGLDVVSQKNRIKELIGYMPQRFGLYKDLTVRENLDFFLDIFGITGKERARRRDRYLGFSNLLPFEDRLANDLSGGMKQKLGLACVLVHEPRLLILDEPTNGVDPVSRQEFWDILLQMREGGMTVLISTAYLDEGEKCDRLALMHNSRILVTGTPAEVRGGSPDLEEALIERIREVDAALVNERFEY
jgi:ABC-2 type transport system ATP-binding protein